MSTIASLITSLAVVYSTVYSDADQRKHQSSASLAFVWGIHRDRWIPRTKGQLRGKCFHLMTSSWSVIYVMSLKSCLSCHIVIFGIRCVRKSPIDLIRIMNEEMVNVGLDCNVLQRTLLSLPCSGYATVSFQLWMYLYQFCIMFNKDTNHQIMNSVLMTSSV